MIVLEELVTFEISDDVLEQADQGNELALSTHIYGPC